MPSMGFARARARKVLQDYRYTRPPIPVEEIAMAEGLPIVRVSDWDDRVSAYLDHGAMTIAVNDRHHPLRRRFSIAHELGHFFLGNSLEQAYEEEIDLEQEQREDEVEANEFASELLVPRAMLMGDFARVKDAARLADLYQVSEHAMWVCLLKGGLIRG